MVEFNVLGHSIYVASALLLVIGYFSMPIVKTVLKRLNLVGVDVHKEGEPEVVESGGIMFLFLLSAFLLFVYRRTYNMSVLYIFIFSALSGLLGFHDDIFTFGKYQKLILMLMIASLTTYLFSGFGVGTLIFVTITLTLIIGSNIFNWFAGLNGLEIGTSTIITFFMMLNLYLLNEMIPFYLTLGLLSLLLPFLVYNKYPASIFPGDSGTLYIGAYLTSLTLAFNLWHIFLPLMSLHILNGFLKVFSAGFFSYAEKKPTKLTESGKLEARDDFLSVVRLLLKRKKLTEKEVVHKIWLIMLAIGAITTLLLQGGVI